MNNDAALTPAQRNKRRSVWVGAVTLVVLILLFVLGGWLRVRDNEAEQDLLLRADAAFLRGAAGQCDGFAEARDAYFKAMKRHLQSKELAAKTSAAKRLGQLCGTDLAPVIRARQELVDSGRFNATDVKDLAFAQLATGDLPGARLTLARMPTDRYCRWLADWLGALTTR